MIFLEKNDFSPIFSVKSRTVSSQFGFPQHKLVSLTLKYVPSCAYCVYLTDFGHLVEVHGSPEIPQKHPGAYLSDSLSVKKLQIFFRACLLGFVKRSTIWWSRFLQFFVVLSQKLKNWRALEKPQKRDFFDFWRIWSRRINFWWMSSQFSLVHLKVQQNLFVMSIFRSKFQKLSAHGPFQNHSRCRKKMKKMCFSEQSQILLTGNKRLKMHSDDLCL